MYRDNMEANWPEISGKLLKQFPKLKPADLLFANGNEESLLRKIQLRLFKSKREVLELIGSM